MGPPERPVALHVSALSPNEYRDYYELVEACDAWTGGAHGHARPTVAELFDWLRQYATQAIDQRTQKHILSFFRSDLGNQQPPHETLLALARLYSHSLNLPQALLLRDMVFVATDAVPLDCAAISSALAQSRKRAAEPSKNPFIAHNATLFGPDGVPTPPSSVPSTSTSPNEALMAPPHPTAIKARPVPPPKRVPPVKVTADLPIASTSQSASSTGKNASRTLTLQNEPGKDNRRIAVPPLPPRKSEEALQTGAAPVPPPRKLPIPSKLDTTRSATSTISATRTSHASQNMPTSPLTSSTHIGINHSVRLVQVSTGDSIASDKAVSSSPVRGRVSRSNSCASGINERLRNTDEPSDVHRNDEVLGGHAGFTWETASPSLRRDYRSNTDHAPKKQSDDSPSTTPRHARAFPASSSPSDTSSLTIDSDGNKEDSVSVATEPLPTPNTRFALFAKGETILPHVTSTTAANGLNRSRTLGSKPSVPPPPRRRVMSSSENPFESPASSMSVSKRNVSSNMRVSGKRRDLTSDVTHLLVQGAKEGEQWMRRAGEELTRRKSSGGNVVVPSKSQKRKNERAEEQTRLMSRDGNDLDSDGSGDGNSADEQEMQQDARTLTQGVDELDVGDDELKDLERRVRRQSEKGQWLELA
ncbi:hypothetical protein OIV83_003050 [Microbotryomycetes sp. JL201]|nr:hypothetical protein OIV83_003050 [Microbotryomycetes sp. JL201]